MTKHRTARIKTGGNIMSGNKEPDELLRSLGVSPNENKKRTVKELFLQKAEEAERTRNENKIKPSSVFQNKKRSFLSFAAGMAAMLILMAGVLAAYNPEFLTGSLTDTGKIIRYRIFPSGMEDPSPETAQKYLGELSILHAPGEGEMIDSQFVKCDGRTLGVTDGGDNRALFAVLKTAFGYDENAEYFDLPDYTARFTDEGFGYHMACRGAKASAGNIENAVVKDEFIYIPVNFTDYKVDYANSVCYGEIVLMKASGKALQKAGYIPCVGQTLDSSDYPLLADILAPGAERFTLPDLSGLSPVDGAVYCIADTGDYPYLNAEG